MIALLVVEDDPLCQMSLKLVLKAFPFDVSFAGSGAAALQSFANEHYDLIFMDVGLPDITGFEITRSIRNQEAELKRDRTPIVMLTAHDDDEARNAASNAGADHFLVKPLTPDKINAITAMLGLR